MALPDKWLSAVLYVALPNRQSGGGQNSSQANYRPVAVANSGPTQVCDWPPISTPVACTTAEFSRENTAGSPQNPESGCSQSRLDSIITSEFDDEYSVVVAARLLLRGFRC